MTDDVFDLDAVAADADAAPFRFRFGGAEFTLAPQPDLRAVAALSAGRLDDALRILLGADQWERMQAVDAVLDIPRFQALFEKYAAHSGTTLGESSASSGS